MKIIIVLATFFAIGQLKEYNSEKVNFLYPQNFELIKERYVDNVNVVLKDGNNSIILNVNKNFQHNSVDKVNIETLKEDIESEIVSSLKKSGVNGKVDIKFHCGKIETNHAKKFIRIESEVNTMGFCLIYQTMFLYLTKNKSCFITLASPDKKSMIPLLNESDCILESITIK